MSTVDLRVKELKRLAALYEEYLNSPLGKGVLDRLREGESYVMKAQDDVIQFTKTQGKAIVYVMKTNPETGQQLNR
jgi:hypothetical protein